jgi:hypothetical protein
MIKNIIEKLKYLLYCIIVITISLILKMWELKRL